MARVRGVRGVSGASQVFSSIVPLLCAMLPDILPYKSMNKVITLQQRRDRWMAEKRKNLALALEELSIYAKEYGGKFYLFGSALGDKFALHSDVDIIADFGSPQADWNAWMDAEDILHKHKLQIDGRPKSGCSKDFLSIISEDWREL